MKITFFGAAGGVTGSKHLIEEDGQRILLDCGTFQGLADVRERNRSLPFAPESINHVVLSHAHIDHCGMLPLLVKRGFTGSIFSTPATKDVASYMMADMAHIELDDAEYRRQHKIGAPDERVPLFSQADVDDAINQFVTVPYVRQSQQWFSINKGIDLKFYDAGHILGSAVSVLHFRQSNSILGFTGDLGAPGMPLLFDPEVPIENIPAFICESTYGSRRHEPLDVAITRLANDIKQVYERGGKMIVPAFSLSRIQVVVYLLHKMIDQKIIPRFPIFVDSPLGVDITQVYQQHRQDYDLETWSDFTHKGEPPLSFTNLKYITSRDESIALNSRPGPFMVISASGMMNSGRVVHHLKNNLSDRKNAVFITGYQAEGTLGRLLLEGAKEVEILGERVKVAADIFLFNEFSAHADNQQLEAYLNKINDLKHVMLVHGEPHQSDDFKQQLIANHPTWDVRKPNEGDTYYFK